MKNARIKLKNNLRVTLNSFLIKADDEPQIARKRRQILVVLKGLGGLDLFGNYLPHHPSYER